MGVLLTASQILKSLDQRLIRCRKFKLRQFLRCHPADVLTIECLRLTVPDRAMKEVQLDRLLGILMPNDVKWNQSGLKVLVQHRYPGQSRKQGVAHGPVSTNEPHGTRGIKSHVGRRL